MTAQRTGDAQIVSQNGQQLAALISVADLRELVYLRGLLSEAGVQVLVVDNTVDTFELELTCATSTDQCHEDIEHNSPPRNS